MEWNRLCQKKSVRRSVSSAAVWCLSLRSSRGHNCRLSRHAGGEKSCQGGNARGNAQAQRSTRVTQHGARKHDGARHFTHMRNISKQTQETARNPAQLKWQETRKQRSLPLDDEGVARLGVVEQDAEGAAVQRRAGAPPVQHEAAQTQALTSKNNPRVKRAGPQGRWDLKLASHPEQKQRDDGTR